MAEAFPPLLGYSIKRLRFFARIVFSLTDGDEKMFISLITQEPLAVAAGRLDDDSCTISTRRLTGSTLWSFFMRAQLWISSGEINL